MTYGWAILIIAIVIVALFQLGILNNSNIAPHAVAGSCQVFHNAAGSSLEGQCNGLPPQYVAQFSGTGSYIYLPAPVTTSHIQTFSMWINTANVLQYQYALDEGSNVYLILVGQPSGTLPYISIYDGGEVHYTTASSNAWYFVASVYDGTHAILYVNGAYVAEEAFNNQNPTALNVGRYGGGGYFFHGLISNVQAYNTSLSASEIQALYQEGIGGAPISPAYVVGWWPLNGGTNDYSGNGNTGIPFSISYNGSWTSGYTAP